MKIFKKGDIIEVLDDAIIGQIMSIKNDTVYIISEDGFELNFKINEIIKRPKPLDDNTFFDYDSFNEVLKEKSETLSLPLVIIFNG